MHGDAVLAAVGRDRDRSHRHTVGRHDAHLGLVDDRARQQRAEAAGVRDREGAAGEIVSREPLRVRSLCEVGGCGRELGERLVFRVADDRHHEALEVEVDGDAEVDGTMHHEVVADDRRVQAGELGERIDDRRA